MAKRIEIEKVENGFVIVNSLYMDEVVYVATNKSECSKILTQILKEEDDKTE